MGGSYWLYPQGDIRDERQASPATAQQPHQVVASHIFDNTPARFCGCSITAKQPNADDLVPDTQVPLAQATGEPAGHEATNRS